MRCSICNNYYHIECIYNSDSSDQDKFSSIGNWVCKTCTKDIFPFNDLNDIDFLDSLCIGDVPYKSIACDISELKNIGFNPFDLNSQNIHSSMFNSNLENFCNNSLNNEYCNSDYYTETSFRHKCIELHKSCDKNKTLSFIHLNIRSFHKNVANFEIFLNNLEYNFAVIGLSETWIKESNVELCNIEGYNCEHLYRKDRIGGGVSIMVNSCITYSVRNDLSILNNDIEAIFIEIDKNQMSSLKNIVVGTVYKPPNRDVYLFINEMDLILNKLRLENKGVYIMGDYNINLLNADNHLPTSEFVDMMYSYGLLPLINKPTRVSNKGSCTLIDNIFCNEFYNKSEFLNGIFYSDISDHFPVFSILINTNYKSNTEQENMKRLYNDCNMQAFSRMISSIDWNFVLLCNNAIESFSAFYDKFVDCYNQCFPLKKFKVKYKNRKPWLSIGLKESIKIKNKLYIQSVKNPIKSNIQHYKTYRNKLNSLLRKCERIHYDELLRQNKNNLAKSWKLIKEIINRKKQDSLSDKYVINGKIENNKNKISNSFNEYYVNVGKNLAKQIPSVSKEATSYISSVLHHSMLILPVDNNEIINVVKSLKETCAGHDGIIAKVLKITYNSFVEPLCHVLNLSLTNGYFPDQLKLSQVVPVFKSGDKLQIGNYRPVSILSTFSKIFEKVMYSRLTSFLEKH